jgi:hypothetical protein
MDEDLLGLFEIALENGRVVLEGSSEELLTDSRVKKAYLGGWSPKEMHSVILSCGGDGILRMLVPARHRKTGPSCRRDLCHMRDLIRVCIL